MSESSWAYFDTSVIVKRYVGERGSPEAQRLLRLHRIISSAIAPLELLSALTRRYGQRELSGPDYSAILSRVKQDRDFWELVEVTPAVLARAEETVLKLNVRALDAIHLSSAATFQDFTGTSLPFITSDERQIGAAEKCGLKVIRVLA